MISLLGVVFDERGTAAVLAPVMERLGSDWSLLSLLVRVAELDKVGELGRVRSFTSFTFFFCKKFP
jgi:hypothetical protein